MDIWKLCNGAAHICPICGDIYRVVESQEQIATLHYVDSFEEQALLEDMLDTVKPPYPEQSDTYHYLLKTPFRYPPLQWGSRFGRIHEPSLFYGSKDIETTLAECAYYRFIFWNSMDAPAPTDKIRTEHTLFTASYKTKTGVRLQLPPFDKYQSELTHPEHYHDSQLMGSLMRESEVDAFEYISARCKDEGICVGLFDIEAFDKKSPKSTEQWLCELSADTVSFKPMAEHKIYHYPITDFFHHNHLPVPA